MSNLSTVLPSAGVTLALLASCATPGGSRPPRLQDPGASSSKGRFLAAHGDFVRGATRTAPMVEVSALHVPEGEVHGEPGDFELTHYDFDARVPIPTSRDTFVIAGAHAGARKYEFSRDVVGASDETLYNAGLRLGAGHFFDDDLVVQGYWQPSIYSDLDGELGSRDLKLWYGAALAVQRTSPDWYWKAGLLFTDATDSGVVPMLGFTWLVGPEWRVDVLFPSYAQIAYEPTPDWTLQAGLEVESEEFHVRSSAATGKLERDIHVQDVRLYLGALRRLGPNASIFGKVGSNVTGHYDWSYTAEPDYDGALEPGLFVQLGLGWSF